MKFNQSILLDTESGKNSTFAVVNCILDYTKSVTNLKLQKLAFLAYGLHLAIYQERIFSSSIEAWKLGPVIKDIYDEFKNHGREQITTRATQLVGDNEFLVPTIPNEYKKDKMSVIATCLYYGNRHSAPELVDLTHNMNCWKKAFNSSVDPKIINDEDIFDDFNKIKSDVIGFVNNY
jgi:uncharacterized phage-associated protein